MRRARLVMGSGRALLDAARAVVPGLDGRVLLVPKGVSLPRRGARFDLRRAAGLRRDAIVFLLPAGLRPVKDPLFALESLARLRRRDPRVAFVHAGEALVEEVAEALRDWERREPWVRSFGPIPFARMAAAYAGASVVLNTSRSEGMANVPFEAMLAGRAVLAPDIPANREAVRHGKTGLLYRAGDPGSFLRAAGRLAADPALRRRLGAAGRREVLASCTPAAEARAVAAAYRRAISPGA